MFEETKLPCDDCGSSDALGRNEDGSTYCFSCNAHHPATSNAKYKVVDYIDSVRYTSLTSRSLTEDTCKKFRYGVSGAHQVAHYFRVNGKLLRKFRDKDKKFWWETKPSKVMLFGQQLWPNTGKMLIITEGEIDCMSISQAFGNKWPMVSIPNGAAAAERDIRSNITFVEGFDKVVLAFDNDDDGRQASRKVADLLHPGKAHIVVWPEGFKDFNDMLKAGRASDMMKMCWNAPVHRPDGIIEGDALWPELEDIYEGRVTKVGYDIPRPELNKRLRGLRKAEITLYTAGTSAGKSTEVHEIGHHLLTQHGLRLGVIALEEPTVDAALRYINIHLSKLIQWGHDGVTRKQYQQAYQDTVGSGRWFSYNHEGSVDSGNLLGHIRYLAVGCKCDFIILDHISIAISGIEGDDRKAIDMLMTGLRQVVSNTGVGIIVVSHLKKTGEGKPFEEGRPISMDDLRGSATLKQIPWNIIAIERDQQDPHDNTKATLKVLKCRATGDVGLADTLKYDKETGRLNVLQPFDVVETSEVIIGDNF